MIQVQRQVVGRAVRAADAQHPLGGDQLGAGGGLEDAPARHDRCAQSQAPHHRPGVELFLSGRRRAKPYQAIGQHAGQDDCMKFVGRYPEVLAR